MAIEIWDNPLIPLETRLESCAGAVAFQRSVATHQRALKEIAEAKVLDWEAIAESWQAMALNGREWLILARDGNQHTYKRLDDAIANMELCLAECNAVQEDRA